MRFLHTADWHLGKMFYGVSLLEDQRILLEQVIDIARDEKPDALVISGDIFDRSVPSADALKLLDETLCRLVGEAGIKVIAISGNHDSSQRIDFVSRILAEGGLHVAGTVGKTPRLVPLEDEAGPVYFCLVPYADPPMVKSQFEGMEIQDHHSALGAIVGAIDSSLPRGCRSVMVTHAFVLGGQASGDSERPLTLGGSGLVGLELFERFNYSALGHLHRPQCVGTKASYSGSLMKYSFSEGNDAKSVSVVEMDRHGTCRERRIPLSPPRDARCIADSFDKIIRNPDAYGKRDDYLSITLCDEGFIFDAIGRLREFFPNVLHIDKSNAWESPGAMGSMADMRLLEPDQLFARFFQQVTGCELSPEEKDELLSVLGEMDKQGREVVSL